MVLGKGYLEKHVRLVECTVFGHKQPWEAMF